MFSAVVSRFERTPLANSTPPQNLISRSTSGVASLDIRRRVGRPVTNVAPRKRQLRCAVQSNLTEDASVTAELHNGQEPDVAVRKPIAEAEPELPLTEPESDAATSADESLPEPVPAETLPENETDEIRPPFKAGDEVTIKVLSRPHRFGVNVALTDWPPKQAFLPYTLFPRPLLSPTATESPEQVPRKQINSGTTLKATVENSPTCDWLHSVWRQIHSARRVANRERLVVSAFHTGQAILGTRLKQLRGLCADENEVIRGYVTDRDKTGLFVAVAGYRCFLPRVWCGRDALRIFESRSKNFPELCLETELDVVVERLELEKNRVLVNNIQAESIKYQSSISIGDLVHGKITNMTKYGAFVRIDGTSKAVLLHIRNISRRVVHAPEDVFVEGEKIYAVVLDIDPTRHRISLGTADLEDEAGEILYNKERVMQNAPAMAARLQKELVDAREVHMHETDEDVSYE